MSRGVCICLTVFVLLLVLAALGVLVALLLVVGRQPPRVETTCGVVEGTFNPTNMVYSFKGIPYALPPNGGNRWNPPVPVTSGGCWDGIKETKEFPAQCMQRDMSYNRPTGSEDCLYLNIFTPASEPKNLRDVLFYIHGGYLQWGNSSTVGYCPDEHVAALLDVVVVTIQYRLNAFGFLVSELLPNRSGNYGLLDQVEALHWVQHNIQEFGGDPNKVSVVGQSSGGTSILALMAMPAAVGLFHNAWMISGSPIFNMSLAEAAKYNDEHLVKKTECNTTSCLLNLNVSTILESIYPEWNVVRDSCDMPKMGVFEPAFAVVDGINIPEPPFDMWEKGAAKMGIPDVPLIIGTTAQETDIEPGLMGSPPSDIKTWTLQHVASYIRERLDDFGDNITEQANLLYADIFKDQDAEYIFTTMSSDIRMNCGNDVMAQKASQGLKSPVYRYVVTQNPSSPGNVVGTSFDAKYAYHAWDDYAFFDAFQHTLRGKPTNGDYAFGNTLRTNIMSILQNGKPTAEDWEPCVNNSNTALITDKVTPVTGYHKKQCDFWNENGFFSYSWIN